MPKPRIKRMFILFAVIFFASITLTAGCISEDSGKVEIVSENDLWFPEMSSVIGIGLSAEYSGGSDVTYEWSADYGGFLHWTPEVIPCDPPCTTDEIVWWTYITEEGAIEKLTTDELPEKVQITVKAKETGTGDILAGSAITLTKTEGHGYCTGDVAG